MLQEALSQVKLEIGSLHADRWVEDMLLAFWQAPHPPPRSQERTAKNETLIASVGTGRWIVRGRVPCNIASSPDLKQTNSLGIPFDSGTVPAYLTGRRRNRVFTPVVQIAVLCRRRHGYFIAC